MEARAGTALKGIDMINGVDISRMFRWPHLFVTLAGFLVLTYSLLGIGSDRIVVRSPLIDDDRRELHVMSFDEMWKTIRDHHVDPNLSEVDWLAVRKELRPRVENARTDPEARAAMLELMRKIRTSHYFYQIGSAADPNSPLNDPFFFVKDDGWHGIEVAWRNEQAIVTGVWRDSPGERCGIKPGWVLLAADGVDVKDRMQKARERNWGPYPERTWRTIAVLQMLSGKPDHGLLMKFLDHNDQIIDKHLFLARAPGRLVRSPLLAARTLRTDTRTLRGNIGYFFFNWFADRELVQRDFRIALETFGQPRGLIIDLRGNRGGMIAATMDLAGVFVANRGKSLGTFKVRSGSQQMLIMPASMLYRGKLAILVDELTASGAELFSAGMQDLKRARVFGSPTSGLSLPATMTELPNGDVFNYVVGDILRPSGTSLEGVGVTPDEIVELDRKKFLESNDPVLDAAVRWISKP